jgi:type 1 glutamine amidotransferase
MRHFPPATLRETAMRQARATLTGVAFAGLVAVTHAVEIDPFDQSGVPLEVDTDDPRLAKIVLVAGKRSHGPGQHEHFAGCALLMNMLRQIPGVFPVMARDGWPRNEAIFKDARSIVFYCDGRGAHPILKPDRLDLLQNHMDAGGGWVNIHYAVDYPKSAGNRILEWMGGYYDADISVNPHWTAEFKVLPDHPITRGVRPFSIRDEWYYNMRWTPDIKGVIPILKAVPPEETRRTADAKLYPGREEITAWAFQRPNGGRSFGFTGGHFHRNWGDENFRRLVVNAILWTACVEIPATGAPVELDPAHLNRHLDAKGRPARVAPASPGQSNP